jgi:hypothetical protein
MGAYTQEKVVDPVCGMEITRRDPDTLISSYKGKPKTPFGRFLARLVRANVKVFGRAGPPCH